MCANRIGARREDVADHCLAKHDDRGMVGEVGVVDESAIGQRPIAHQRQRCRSAIGLGLILGLTLPINFKSPYLAVNPSDFWRRWHITLSTWLRDYLYIPLGGNRVSRNRMLINLMVVMALGGLWHGANWTFVLWGILHGIYLVIYKMFDHKEKGYQYNFFQNIVFFHLVCLAWIIFRSPDINQAVIYLRKMFSGDFSMNSIPSVLAVIMLTISILVHNIVEVRNNEIQEKFGTLHWLIQAACMFAFLVVLSLLGLKGVSHKAFIYFQF